LVVREYENNIGFSLFGGGDVAMVALGPRGRRPADSLPAFWGRSGGRRRARPGGCGVGVGVRERRQGGEGGRGRPGKDDRHDRRRPHGFTRLGARHGGDLQPANTTSM